MCRASKYFMHLEGVEGGMEGVVEWTRGVEGGVEEIGEG